MPRPPGEELPAPTASAFDGCFAGAAVSPGLRQVWQVAAPDLPAEIEPFSFVTPGLLGHLVRALGLSSGQTLVDLACGRGGPGLWLARETGASLIGVDFSPVAVAQAAERAPRFGLADRARFVVGDLCGTGLPDAGADAVVSVDAMQFAADTGAAAREAFRILREGGRLVLTNWQPRTLGDPRLPARWRRIDWARTFAEADFGDVRVEARPEWHDFYTRVYRVALDLGDPGRDAPLAALQEEARRTLPMADLKDRVVVTARRPGD